MKNIFKSQRDGFMWLKIDYKIAMSLFVNSAVELYKLDIDNGVEALIETLEDFQKAQKQGLAICIEICFEKDILNTP